MFVLSVRWLAGRVWKEGTKEGRLAPYIPSHPPTCACLLRFVSSSAAHLIA